MFVIVFMGLLVSACQQSAPLGNHPLSTASPPETTASQPNALLDDGDREMLKISEAGKRFILEMQNSTEPAGKRDGHLGDAREAFARYLNLDTLYVSGVLMDPNTPDIYTCMISGYNAYNYPRSVNVIFSKSESMEWFCPMAHYYQMSDAALETYLAFLQTDDADGLAAWLSWDAPPSQAMIDAARDTLAYYQSWCDLSALTVREDEYALSYDIFIKGFMYTIEDAKGNTFPVETRFGDGACFPILPHRYD